MSDLRVYKSMPEWDSDTLPLGFRQKHNTREGTWARLTVRAGSLRFTALSEQGEVLSSRALDASSEPLLVEPGAWHRVEPLDGALRCQLSFLCHPDRYFEKKHQLTAPHSEVRALLPELEASAGRAVLDLGSGRGRNSFFLAQRGFELTAVDRSETALATLRAIQAAEGIEFASRVYDINRAALTDVLAGSGGEIDHVICTVVFQFLDPERVPAILADMQAVTRSGGLHLIVAPVSTQQEPCPIAFPSVFAPDELREHYASWQMLRYEESWGEFHKTNERGERLRSRFCTLVAQKP